MAKASKDMIDAETARKIKRMSVPKLNSYLYSIYLSGYTAGASDNLADKLKAMARPGPKETRSQ